VNRESGDGEYPDDEEERFAIDAVLTPVNTLSREVIKRSFSRRRALDH